MIPEDDRDSDDDKSSPGTRLGACGCLLCGLLTVFMFATTLTSGVHPQCRDTLTLAGSVPRLAEASPKYGPALPEIRKFDEWQSQAFLHVLIREEGEDVFVRTSQLAADFECGDAAPYLAERLNDSSPAVRVAAAAALQRLTGTVPEGPYPSWEEWHANRPVLLLRTWVIGKRHLTIVACLAYLAIALLLWCVFKRTGRATPFCWVLLLPAGLAVFSSLPAEKWTPGGSFAIQGQATPFWFSHGAIRFARSVWWVDWTGCLIVLGWVAIGVLSLLIQYRADKQRRRLSRADSPASREDESAP